MDNDFRRLAGLTDVRMLAEGVEEAIIKKLAKKTKIGDYNIRDVHAALDVIDPGWTLEVTVAPMPMKDGPLNPELKDRNDIARAFQKQYDLNHTDMTYYGPTSMGLSWAIRTNGGPAPAHGSETEKNARSENPSKSEVDTVCKAFIELVLKGVVQQKDPPHPEVGVVYMAPLGKPKVEEVVSPHVQGITYYSVTWKLSSVKRGTEVHRLTSPKGEVIDLEGAAPALWTRLYKTDIDKKAQAYLDDNGVAAKDAAKKAMKNYNANDVVGHCGICKNVQKLRKNELVLHGYLRPGYGWIQGSCFGVGYKAWELSPESVEAYIVMLTKQIPLAEQTISFLKRKASFTVYIDDKFLVKGSGQGYRCYEVTKDAFTLADEKKIAYSELKELGASVVHPYALDAAQAAKVFDDEKAHVVQRAEANLKQMIEVRKQSVRDVADWKLQKLPGAPAEEGVMGSMRKLAGITERR